MKRTIYNRQHPKMLIRDWEQKQRSIIRSKSNDELSHTIKELGGIVPHKRKDKIEALVRYETGKLTGTILEEQKKQIAILKESHPEPSKEEEQQANETGLYTALMDFGIVKATVIQ